MDSYLNIISLALAFAALVPVIAPGTKSRWWVVTVALLSGVILVAVFQVFSEYQQQEEVGKVETDISNLLALHGNGLTFDQIYDNLYYPTFQSTNEALDNLVGGRKVTSVKVEAVDSIGNVYVIRKFLNE